MGHEVWTEDRRDNRLQISLKLKKAIRQVLSILFSRVSDRFRKVYYPTQKERNIIQQHTDSFIRQYLTITEPIFSADKKQLLHYGFEAYVVGSDQVWRPMYSPCLTNYFLDFTKNDTVKRIAYAASFGTDEWEYTKRQTEICSRLVQRFDAVSVREESGVGLCEKYLHVNASHVLDPTLLLDMDDYMHLIDNEQMRLDGSGGVYTYILDANSEKIKIINSVSRNLDLAPFTVMPQKNFYQAGPELIDQCVYAPVSMWLQGFKDAKFVVTDSFHGTVFSIMFNKPFIVIANKSRGLSRFTSLLKMVGLENRLLFSASELTDELIKSTIDFSAVKASIASERIQSIEFLSKYLKMN